MDTNLDLEVSIGDIAGLLEDETEETLAEEAADESLPDEEQQGEEGEEGEEDDEVEIDGKSYRVPKAIKDAVLMHRDYTQKTQKVAEERRVVEERAHALQQRESLMAQTFEKAVEFREVQNRLAQYEQIDWQALAEKDPAQAQKLHFAYQQLQRDAQVKWHALQEGQSQAEQLSQQQRQQLLAQAEQDLKARLPEFGPQLAAKIVEASKAAYGFSAEELEGLTDARHVHVLHDAMKWRELQAAKPKAMRAVAEAPRAIKPAAQPRRTNQAASDRLRKTGRTEDLAAFL